MIGIYKITSPSGRVYIGQSINIYNRFRDYKKLINCKQQIRLYSSFLKYGVENHFFEIIIECDENKLNDLERFYQDLHEVLGKKGLNCRLTKTSDRSGKMSEESKKRISISKTNPSEEVRKNISNARKGIAPKYKNMEERNRKISEALTGKKLSEEHRKKLSIAQTGLKRSPESIKKSVESRRGFKMPESAKNKLSELKRGGKNPMAKKVVNIETGEKFDSAADAAIHLGIKTNALYHHLKGRVLTNRLPFRYA